jgi:hypothetical protein
MTTAVIIAWFVLHALCWWYMSKTPKTAKKTSCKAHR